LGKNWGRKPIFIGGGWRRKLNLKNYFLGLLIIWGNKVTWIGLGFQTWGSYLKEVGFLYLPGFGTLFVMASI